MFDLTDDTIVAVSSAPGWADRGIVRMSGPAALSIAAELFAAESGLELAAQSGFTRLCGQVRVDGLSNSGSTARANAAGSAVRTSLACPAECYLFRAPRSYTRQDCVELHVPGSPPLLAMLVDAAVARGARPAQPGEFTARAYLAGALDLAQAEAVAAVIRARSDAELRAAHALRRGDLSQRIAAACDRLADLVALVEADIDFAEEPIDFITPDELHRRALDLHGELTRLVEQADSTERLTALPTILLLGAPNAGKSSLLNALSGMDRAICSAVAGTTRDVLSAPIALGRAEALLLDAAGHEPPGPAASEDERAAAVQAAMLRAAVDADLICLVVDLNLDVSDASLAPLQAVERTAAVVAANKIDLLAPNTATARIERLSRTGVGPVCGVSATVGTGLADLRRVLAEQLQGGPTEENRAVALNARQRQSLKNACAALDRAAALAGQARQTIDAADLVALELREALDALGAVTGAVTTEDLLGRVFANFCIGK